MPTTQTTQYDDGRAFAFFQTIDVEGLTPLVSISEKRNPLILRTRNQRPAKIERAYAPIGIGRTFDFTEAGFTTMPPQDPEKEQTLREWLAESILQDKKNFHCYGADAFYLCNPVTTWSARSGTMTDLSYTVIFHQLLNPDS